MAEQRWLMVVTALCGAWLAAAQAIADGAGGVPTTFAGEITYAPVDVYYPEQFATVGHTALPQLLAALVPGFVHPEPALAVGTDHARPSAFRGLAPDHMLVLLNGKRRHEAAWLHRADSYGRGSQGTDLSVIPVSAVKRIEVLRDGASARYGSGAVAGVLNVVLKDQRDGGSLTATFGQYRTHFDGVKDFAGFAAVSPSEFFLRERGDLNTDDGEGDTLTLSAHGGFSLFDAGYLDLSVEYRDREPSNRSGFDPRRIFPDLPNGDWDPREQFVDRRTHRYGNPELEDLNLLAAFGAPLDGGGEWYGFIGYSARNAESADGFRLASGPASVEALFPAGYLPLIDSDAEDRYFTLGARGERWGWGWDLSYTQGENETDWSVSDTVNASLGAISPTAFRAGNYEGRHTVFNLDLLRHVNVGLTDPVEVRMGLESRDVEYENEPGDFAAEVAGGARGAAGELLAPGAQGFFGIRQADDFDDNVMALGAYVTVNAVVTPALGTTLALRLDDEEDNRDLSAHLGARWQATRQLALRASLSSNFRTPSAAQTHFRATELLVSGGSIAEAGVYATDHPAARALGAGDLDSESALNLNAGVIYQPLPGLAVELDGYQIDVDDRIVLSDPLGGAEAQALLAAAGVSGVESVQYFFNGVDTRTRGVDLRLRYDWQSPWGAVAWTAGLNVSDTEVTGTAAPAGGVVRFGSQSRAQLESWTPEHKLHVGARWAGERLTLNLRVVSFGDVVDRGATAAEDLTLESDFLVDMAADYRLNDSAVLGVGVHNFLDAYPDARSRDDADPVINRVIPYSAYSPYGFNGRFVYLRLGVAL